MGGPLTLSMGENPNDSKGPMMMGMGGQPMFMGLGGPMSMGGGGKPKEPTLSGP